MNLGASNLLYKVNKYTAP